MTNGDMMRAVFPNIKMWGESKGTLDYSLGGMVHRVMKSWWNAEYKESSVSEKPNRWIPVSERLPEKKTEVLATTVWGDVTIATMDSANDWFIHEGATNAEDDEILAWMPLPEIYKKESEGK